MERYRFVSEAGAYYVTFSIVDWLPVFVSEAACRIVTDSLNFCHEHKGLRTNAFVIMPTHMHAIVFDANWNADALQRALTDFRKFTGRQLLDYSAKHMPACFSRVFESQAGGDRERRFWQSSRHPEAIQSEPFWRQKLDYLHELKYPGIVEIGTIATRVGSKSFELAHGVFQNGTCAGTGSVVMVFFDLDRRASAAPPDEIRALVTELLVAPGVGKS